MIRPVENRTRFFTTVREPVARMMSAYGEVDAKCEGLKRGSDDCKGTRYWALPRRVREPLRFLAFHDDYERHRIPKSVRRSTRRPRGSTSAISLTSLSPRYSLEPKDRVAAIERSCEETRAGDRWPGTAMSSVDRMALNEVSVSGEGARGRLLHVARAHICVCLWALFASGIRSQRNVPRRKQVPTRSRLLWMRQRAPGTCAGRERRKRARDKSATASS